MVYIIIPVHNRIQLTRNCLLSLKSQSIQKVSTIVIDDGSSDGTSDMIQREFPEVVLLRGDGNLWWTGAINLGVEYALGQTGQNDYILTLNNDTVVYRDYVQTLLNSALNYPRSLIGSISVSDEDESTIVDGGVRFNWLTSKYTNLAKGRRYKDILHADMLIHQVDVLSGRGTLIPIDVFQKIGLYDFKRLPHYGADYEFSRRANMKGYNLLVNYKAVVISNVKTTGLNNRVNKLKFSDFIRSFFSIRSANNLVTRWNFAHLCCSSLQFPVFFVCSAVKIIVGSLLYQIGFINRANIKKSHHKRGATEKGLAKLTT